MNSHLSSAYTIFFSCSVKGLLPTFLTLPTIFIFSAIIFFFEIHFIAIPELEIKLAALYKKWRLLVPYKAL